MLGRLLLLISIAVVMAACGATGPKFSQLEGSRAEKATVYIYRPWAALDGAAAPTIQIDGVDSFDLGNGGYEVVSLPSGVHRITVKGGAFMSNWRAGEMNVEFPLEENKYYFLRLSAELQDVGGYGNIISVSGQYRFGAVDKNFALQELKESKKN